MEDNIKTLKNFENSIYELKEAYKKVAGVTKEFSNKFKDILSKSKENNANSPFAYFKDFIRITTSNISGAFLSLSTTLQNEYVQLKEREIFLYKERKQLSQSLKEKQNQLKIANEQYNVALKEMQKATKHEGDSQKGQKTEHFNSDAFKFERIRQILDRNMRNIQNVQDSLDSHSSDSSRAIFEDVRSSIKIISESQTSIYTSMSRSFSTLADQIGTDILANLKESTSSAIQNYKNSIHFNFRLTPKLPKGSNEVQQLMTPNQERTMKRRLSENFLYEKENKKPSKFMPNAYNNPHEDTIEIHSLLSNKALPSRTRAISEFSSPIVKTTNSCAHQKARERSIDPKRYGRTDSQKDLDYPLKDRTVCAQQENYAVNDGIAQDNWHLKKQIVAKNTYNYPLNDQIIPDQQYQQSGQKRQDSSREYSSHPSQQEKSKIRLPPTPSRTENKVPQHVENRSNHKNKAQQYYLEQQASSPILKRRQEEENQNEYYSQVNGQKSNSSTHGCNYAEQCACQMHQQQHQPQTTQQQYSQQSLDYTKMIKLFQTNASGISTPTRSTNFNMQNHLPPSTKQSEHIKRITNQAINMVQAVHKNANCQSIIVNHVESDDSSRYEYNPTLQNCIIPNDSAILFSQESCSNQKYIQPQVQKSDKQIIHPDHWQSKKVYTYTLNPYQ